MIKLFWSNPMDRVLVLVRHGQSEWNLQNLFTGCRDPGLTDVGVEEARTAARRLQAMRIQFAVAFTSALSRAERTSDIILRELGQAGIPTIRDKALNERDYGDLSGLNKNEARARWGKEQVNAWRRSYDIRPPGGESLKDTLARTLPYYVRAILPRVMRGEAALVSAHGNSLRTLVMVLDGLTPEAVPTLEIGTGIPLVYSLNADTTVASKDVLTNDNALGSAEGPPQRTPRNRDRQD
jgi:2,3-bisphosphoglycerate-dependent phosphoglycerate mutase